MVIMLIYYISQSSYNCLIFLLFKQVISPISYYCWNMISDAKLVLFSNDGLYFFNKEW